MSDLINRDYAIDDLHSKSQLQIWDTEDVEVWINDLPSASTDLSTFSDKLWKIAYERGKKEGMQQLHDYQVECLKSHDELQLYPQFEGMITHFLHDTTNCLLMERGEKE